MIVYNLRNMPKQLNKRVHVKEAILSPLLEDPPRSTYALADVPPIGIQPSIPSR
jgi:hypothetical protein